MSAPAAPATIRRSTRTVVLACLAQVYFSGVFFVAVPLALLWWRGRPLRVAADPWTVLGAAVVVAANAFVVRLVRRFVVEGQGTQVPIDPPRSMVLAGAYRRTRNPMYLAYVLVIAGEALIFRWWGLALYALAFWAVFHAYVVWREEPLLLARFGDGYRRYAASVPRWLGRRRDIR